MVRRKKKYTTASGYIGITISGTFMSGARSEIYLFVGYILNNEHHDITGKKINSDTVCEVVETKENKIIEGILTF